MADTPRPATLDVEVAYAEPDSQKLIALSVPPGTTAIEAVRQSQIARLFPHLDVDSSTLGVFGTRVPPERELQHGDRVEIYRPLRADPREVRRQLARLGKTMGRGGQSG